MARAAVKAKQQARAKAKPQPTPLKRGRGRKRHASGGNPNQQLFFIKLRRHAKWAYVLLALLFATTFAALGVGSGSNSGLDQLFSGIFGSSSSAPSVSKAQQEVKDHPNHAKGFRDLATAYEAKGDTANAITALQSYTTLEEKNANAFSELGNLQLQQAQSYATQYRAAATAAQEAAPSQSFLPSGTLGTAIGSNPIEQAQSTKATSSVQDVYQRAILAYQNAVDSYQTVAKLRPNDPNAQFQLANAAESAGENTVAVGALKKYLKLNPHTPQRAQVQSLIKQLSPAPAKPAKQSSKSK